MAIIVIIILAVSVILTISNNNPIESANKAKYQNDLKAIQEAISLYETEKYSNSYLENIEYVQTIVEGDEMVSLFPSTSDYKDKVKVVDGELVIIDSKLNSKERKWASEIGIKRLPVIPKGFKYLEGTPNTGFVIINETDENEFVWIPVEDFSGFKRESFTFTELVSNYTEPLNYDNNIVESQTEKNEYKAMYESVKKYGGFYIGRYEASDNGEGKAQSKKNQASWSYIVWGNNMTDLSGGAVGLARGVYPDSETKKEGEAVSTLVYGVQWDAIVRWISRNYSDTLRDATKYGSYGVDAKINTGSNEQYKTNNIYDLCRKCK